MTRRQNHFTGGLGANMADLRNEPADNLEARGLIGKAFAAYGRIHERWCSPPPTDWRPAPEDLAAFQEFRAAREEWIKEKMNAWLDEAVKPGDSWIEALESLR